MMMLMIVLALALAGCATPTSPAASESAAEGAADVTSAEAATGETGAEREVMVVGVQGLPGGLDPAGQLSNVGTRVTYSIFDTLIRRDFLNNNELVPGLAVSWERISDTVLELKLREGVTFHNGDPFTAHDVEYTFNRLNDPDTTLVEARGYFVGFSQITVVDDYTVQIETVAPDPLIEQRLASWGSWIVPRDYIAEIGGDEAFALAAIGTGPFRIVEMETDNQLVLERYDGYWDELPPVQSLVFRVIPEPSTRVTALLNGEVDIITNIPPDLISTLDGNTEAVLKQVPLANVHVIRYNTKHPVLQDARLRQAMNLAIDRQLLIDTLWDGKAVPLRSHQFDEYGTLFNADRPITEYNLERARELVEASDYDGSVINYETQAQYYTLGLQAGEAIVEMWREAGINAQIRLRQPGDNIPPEESMVANWSNSSILADPDGTLWRSWGADANVQARFWNAPTEFNDLGWEARTSLDTELRYNNYQRMLDIWEEEAPGTVLYIPVENYGVAADVAWEPYPFYYMDFRAYNLAFGE